VEGLTIYKSGPATGCLLASSQGSSEFLVYDRETLERLGGPFTQGLLVTHDGGNTPEVVDDEGEALDIDTTDRVRKRKQ
jgi:myo-inositol-hexaphosphate 3-phosphohydrolase